MPRKKQHYVNNEQFLIVMRDYRENYLKSKDDETTPPQIPDYAGECFLKIAERLSHRPNFINYAFREEMVSDGIENCVMYASNFNPEKSTNPFAYFTQIIYYAFLRRIEKEKKQLYIKYKTMDEFSSLEDNSDMAAMSAKESASVVSGASPMTADKRASIYDFIHAFEEKKRAKKKPKPEVDKNLAKLSPLVEFMEEAYA
jgi:DNA-directed RNA polymerase specialized sigma24 family protein|tara:strand:- start:439 stop:1038 length:600 start_codon:yes stop_codon:yes gene_type:complete